MSRKKNTKKNSSLIPLCATGGLFLGIGLGALMDNLLLIMFLGLAAGIGAGYYFDQRASSRRKKNRSAPR